MSTKDIYFEKGKNEIIADVLIGVLPLDISSFSDLHDHVDANEYCGFCADGYTASEDCVFENEVQTMLDNWIKSFAFSEELAQWKKIESENDLPAMEGRYPIINDGFYWHSVWFNSVANVWGHGDFNPTHYKEKIIR